MSLFNVELQMFRAFRERTSMSYRPLTMFYGQNQAGKSTLLRLLPLLADSIYERNGALNMASESLASNNFKELGHIGGGVGIPSLPILHLKKDMNGTSDLELQFGDEEGLIVNRIRLNNNNKRIMNLNWEKTEERRGESFSAEYQGTINETDWIGRLEFDSLFPSQLPENVAPFIENLKHEFASLKRLQWLRANRIRLDERPAKMLSRCCAADGSDIAKKIPESARHQILENAANWLRAQDNLASNISIDAQQNLRIGTHGRLDLPLYLAGEGLRALLPILLCACWAENKDTFAPTMLAVEEPEAHLHPQLQVALFDRLITTIDKNIPVVLETHSVYMLRAMQLAVLKGDIRPDDVALYWVEQRDGHSILTKINVEANATLNNWRPDVFEKEQELAQKIMEMRWTIGSRN